MSKDDNEEMDCADCDYTDCADTDWEGIYHEHFPQEWAVNHEPGTGPHECLNCADYGCVEDIFIGYCANCAIYVYKGTRGRGFMGDGVEYHDDDVMEFPSAFDTYLNGVVFEEQEEEEEEPIDNSTISIMDCHFEGGYNDF
jgi:hypothetical protein